MIRGAPTRAHGTALRYERGCHCDACRKANKVYKQQLRMGHKTRIFVSATYARRHIRFLLTSGWSLRTLSKHLGLSFTTLQAVASGKRTQIEEHTENRIMGAHTLYAPFKNKAPNGGRTPKWAGEKEEDTDVLS